MTSGLVSAHSRLPTNRGSPTALLPSQTKGWPHKCFLGGCSSRMGGEAATSWSAGVCLAACCPVTRSLWGVNVNVRCFTSKPIVGYFLHDDPWQRGYLLLIPCGGKNRREPFPLVSYLLMFSFLWCWALLEPPSLQGGPAMPFCHGDAAGHPPACFLGLPVVYKPSSRLHRSFLQNYF